MYFDSHTHLNSSQLFDNREEYLKNFIDIAGKGLINVGADEIYNQRALNIIQNFSNPDFIFKTALGFHPFEAVEGRIVKSNINQKLQIIKSNIEEYQKDIIAIGECGIDLHYNGAMESLNDQNIIFASQCDLAQQLNLPIVIHSRSAFDQTIDVLKNYKNLTIYFHCWGYQSDQIKIVQDMFPNVFVGFCGNISYKKADDLRLSINNLDIHKLLLETDAPYLSPQNIRSEMNQPSNIQYIYKYVGECLGIDINILQNHIKNNFYKLINQ